MWVQLKLIVILAFCSVVVSVAQANHFHKSPDNRASADTPESRLMWDLMDQRPYDPSILLPISEDSPEAIQMTGRILAAALCMKSNTTNVLNGDIAEVIESMRVFRNGDLSTADDWNSEDALATWTFPPHEPEFGGPETTGLVTLDPDNGWWKNLGNTFGFDQAFLNSGSYEGEIRSNDQRIIVSFRGTDDIGEGLTAAYTVPVRHRGVRYWHGAVAYYRSLEEPEENVLSDNEKISKWLDQFDAKNKKVYFIGHSLGGSAATIAIRDFALRTQDSEDPNYNEYQYAPTLHTIGAPPTVHCSSIPGWFPGGGWLARFFTRIFFRCQPNLARDVSAYESTVVNVKGERVPLRNRLHYWANVRDPAPFLWTPKNSDSYSIIKAKNSLSHVGTLREMYLGAEDQPNLANKVADWTIIKYTGRNWSTFQGLIDLTWRALWTTTVPITEFHDQRHYANGLEHFTSGERWWSRLYGPTTDDDSIFQTKRDAAGKFLSKPICGEKSSYHENILPFEATVTPNVPTRDDSTMRESDLRVDGNEISITLKNDKWIEIDDGFDGQRMNIIDGLRTSVDSVWNREVISRLNAENVVRASSRTVNITLEPAPDYEIAADEAVDVTVPATALITNIKDLKTVNNLLIFADATTTSSSNSATNSTQKSGGSGSTGPFSLVILLLMAGLIRFRRLQAD